MRFKSVLVLAVLLCAGCATKQAYEGPRLGRDEVARITGDMAFTAGVPVLALLRQVNGEALSVSQNAVDVLPGTHQLLVDCRVQQAQTTVRFSLDVEVSAGQRYRLVAETGPGLRECSAVTLEAVGR